MHQIIIVDDLLGQHQRIENMTRELLGKTCGRQIEFLHYTDSLEFLKMLDKLDPRRIALIFVDQRFTEPKAKKLVLSQNRDPEQEGGYIVRQLLKRDLQKKIFFFGRNIPGIDNALLDMSPATLYERNIFTFTAVKLADIGLLGKCPFQFHIRVPEEVYQYLKQSPAKKSLRITYLLHPLKRFWHCFYLSWEGSTSWKEIMSKGERLFNPREDTNFPESVYRLLSVFSLLQSLRKDQNQIVPVKGDWKLIKQKLVELSGIGTTDACWSWLNDIHDGPGFRTNQFSFWQREYGLSPDFLRDLVCNLGSSGYCMLADVRFFSEDGKKELFKIF